MQGRAGKHRRKIQETRIPLLFWSRPLYSLPRDSRRPHYCARSPVALRGLLYSASLADPALQFSFYSLTACFRDSSIGFWSFRVNTQSPGPTRELYMMPSGQLYGREPTWTVVRSGAAARSSTWRLLSSLRPDQHGAYSEQPLRKVAAGPAGAHHPGLCRHSGSRCPGNCREDVGRENEVRRLRAHSRNPDCTALTGTQAASGESPALHLGWQVTSAGEGLASLPSFCVCPLCLLSRSEPCAALPTVASEHW